LVDREVAIQQVRAIGTCVAVCGRNTKSPLAAGADTVLLHQAALLVHIRAVYAELRGAYGWPRMWRELRRRGVRVGKERVRLRKRRAGRFSGFDAFC
jgi:hypothetical protein